MKSRYKLILAIILATVILTTPLQAREINLKVDGQNIKENMVIIKGRTMVPARIIPDYFPAELRWEEKDRNLKLITNNLTISFKVGSTVAVVNSQIIPLSTSTRLINNQVYVPLRALVKIYGGDLIWKAGTRTIYYYSNRIKNIKVKNNEGENQISIITDSLPDYEVDLYNNPKRLVIDLKEISLANFKNTISVGSDIVKRIRLSQFKLNPSMVRVVVDLNQYSSYQIEKLDSGLLIKIKDNPQVVTSSIRERGSNLRKKTKKIVIDAGHGGEDPGAIGFSGLKEKKINYQIATRIDKLLTQAGFNTLMTREDDRFVSLAGRAQKANNWGADIFVSIHANFNYKSQINGTATYAHWYSSEKNWALAWYIQSELINQIQLRDNGLKAANFVVLRKTNMPAVLVETAFISNPREERLLANKNFQERVARGIVEGIKKYFSKQDKG